MAIFQRELPEDRTYGEAVHSARQDWERLAHQHLVTWSLDLSGNVVWSCYCSPTTARNAAGMNTHILESVRRERGPTRGPKR